MTAFGFFVASFLRKVRYCKLGWLAWLPAGRSWRCKHTAPVRVRTNVKLCAAAMQRRPLPRSPPASCCLWWPGSSSSSSPLASPTAPATAPPPSPPSAPCPGACCPRGCRIWQTPPQVQHSRPARCPQAAAACRWAPRRRALGGCRSGVWLLRWHRMLLAVHLASASGLWADISCPAGMSVWTLGTTQGTV